jgi:hypothetical protein
MRHQTCTRVRLAPSEKETKSVPPSSHAVPRSKKGNVHSSVPSLPIPPSPYAVVPQSPSGSLAIFPGQRPSPKSSARSPPPILSQPSPSPPGGASPLLHGLPITPAPTARQRRRTPPHHERREISTLGRRGGRRWRTPTDRNQLLGTRVAPVSHHTHLLSSILTHPS